MIENKPPSYLEKLLKEDGIEKMVGIPVEKPDDSHSNYFNYVSEITVNCSRKLISDFGTENWFKVFQESYNLDIGHNTRYQQNSLNEVTMSFERKGSVTLVVKDDGFRFFYNKGDEKSKGIVYKFIARLRKEK